MGAGNSDPYEYLTGVGEGENEFGSANPVQLLNNLRIEEKTS
jgi:hypothetical protein